MRNPTRILGYVLLGALIVSIPVSAQIAPMRQQLVALELYSGVQPNTRGTEEVVFSDKIDIEGVPWIRVIFDSVQLEGDSYITITSELDGETQILNSATMAEWGTSTPPLWWSMACKSHSPWMCAFPKVCWKPAFAG